MCAELCMCCIVLCVVVRCMCFVGIELRCVFLFVVLCGSLLCCVVLS